MPPPVSVTDKEVSDFGVIGGRPGLSAREEFGLDGSFGATQVYRCNWADRYTVISQAAASPYPHNSGANAYLWNANIVGVGRSSASAGLITYTWAIVTLHFSTVAPYYTGGKWVTEEISEFNFTVPIPTDDLSWDSASGDRVEETAAFSKSVSGLLYHVRYYHVASVPTSILTLKDCCNSVTFNTLTFGLSFSPGYIWYKDSYVKRTIALGGSPDFMVGLTFAYRNADWNKKWRPGYGWRDVYSRQSGTQVIFHTPANLSLY